MAKKNIDIWTQYATQVRNRLNDFFLQEVGENYPKKIYAVYGTGTLEERNVDRLTYGLYGDGLWFSGKHPSKQDIEKVKAKVENPAELEKRQIGFAYHAEKSSSTCFPYDTAPHWAELFFDKGEAENRAIIVKEKYEAEKAFDLLHKKDAHYDYAKNGYKFLGWQNSWKHVYFDADGNQTDDPAKRKTFGYTKEAYPEYGACRELKHRIIDFSHNQQGSEHSVSCPVCMIYWKYDSSD